MYFFFLTFQADKSSSKNPSIKRKSDAAYENGDYDKRRREEPKGITDEEREKILEMLDNEPEVQITAYSCHVLYTFVDKFE